MHHGYLRAASECNITALSATELSVIDARFLVSQPGQASKEGPSHTQLYAAHYVNALNFMVQEQVSLTDLACPDIDVVQLAERAFGKASSKDKEGGFSEKGSLQSLPAGKTREGSGIYQLFAKVSDVFKRGSTSNFDDDPSNFFSFSKRSRVERITEKTEFSRDD